MAQPTDNSSTEEDQDALLPGREMAIRLNVFEGPLDLLLFLIRKNELDIYDIPIEEVTRQYLDVLHEMDHLSLEVAGEFFVMASTLMYIKSRMLLPVNEQDAQPDDDHEEADPRWELVEQLLEYKRFKEASEQIRQLVEEQQDYLPRIYKEGEDERDPRPLKSSDRIELWNTFNLVLRRLAEQIVEGEIRDEQVTVADRMEHVLHRLTTSQSFLFTELFENEEITTNKLVATLLAVLELTRLKKLFLAQEAIYGDIRCDARNDAEDPGELLPEDEEEQADAPEAAIEDEPDATAEAIEGEDIPVGESAAPEDEDAEDNEASAMNTADSGDLEEADETNGDKANEIDDNIPEDEDAEDERPTR